VNAKPLDEKAIFEVARNIPSEDARVDYLAHACGGDQTLYDRVCTLLRMSEEDPDFLESPALDLGTLTAGVSITEAPGTLLGPYKLIERIGEGGMGLVFLARQQELVERDVALKIIRPGMDSRQVVARFEAERQALALMDHPNIARVLDAGTTESGRPYFVMDLVRGIPITEYCDREQLTVRQRLELFILVCQAVQHAHQKGVIHRDIKPTNVLVTLHDGTPVPKVIDFGVAKATTCKLTPETVVTEVAQVIGTPLYMSPEQAELNGLDVDTRTDVYSLGVLLYELLTGATPVEQARLSEVSYDEMRRIIREEEAPQPSSRIATLGEASATIAENRRSDARTLIRQLKGELDWTVMKALEKDRTWRYGTADALAKDIRRYLNDEPVEACPPSAVYRFRKLVRRNLRLAMAVAVAVLGLVLGTGVATWQAVRATKAEETALRQKTAAEQAVERERGVRVESERQRARAEANLRLALDALEEVYLGVLSRRTFEGRGSRSAEESLLQSTLKFYELFADTNRTAPETWSLVAAVYDDVLKIRRELAEQSPGVVGYDFLLARANAGLASLLESGGRTGEAIALYDLALGTQKQLVESFPTVAEYRDDLAATHESLTKLQLAAGQDDQAEQHRAAAERVRSAAAAAAQSRPIDAIRFDRFADPAGLRLLGDAALVDDRLRLTPRGPTRRLGAAWTAEKRLVAFGFDTDFSFQLRGGEDDGFAFVIQNHGPTSLGKDGAGLGFGGGFDSAGGIPGSLAVEFDTVTNPEFCDLPADHLSVQSNGASANSPHHAYSLGATVAPVDLNDGNVHTARVDYVPGRLTVFVDRSTEPVLSVPVELSVLLPLDRGRAWVGFTAATGGGGGQNHDILSWEYVSLVDDLAAKDFLSSHPSFNGKPKAAANNTVPPPHAHASRLPLNEEGQDERGPLSADVSFLTKALAFYRAFAEQNCDDPSSQWEIAKAYWRVGEIMPMLAEGGSGDAGDGQAEAGRLTAVRIWIALGERILRNAEQGERVALAQACKRRAQICYRLGEYGKEIQYWTASALLNPKDPLLHNALAMALIVSPDPQFRDPPRAMRSARRGLELQPDHAGIINTLGAAQYYAGQWQAAIESLHRSDALENYKGSAYNGFFLAMAYWQIGQQDQARTWYGKALTWMEKNGPESEDLLRFRAEAADLLGMDEQTEQKPGEAKP